jgi:predicted dehydrogenase
VIGCGFFAQNHLHAWKDLAGEVELVAVCDKDRIKAEAAAAMFGVPGIYDDAAQMFGRERLDFVDVATTMPSHKPLVLLAAAHKVPTIVQKPFAPTWEECVDMVEACRSAGIPLMVHENFRFQTPLSAVTRVVESGAIGQPHWARITFRTNYDVYANQPYLALEEQLIILDLGIHVLDMARVYLGEVTRLSCETQRINPKIRAEDMATMLLRHESGAVSVVDCTYESKQVPDPFPQTLVHLEGPRGSIRLDAGYKMVVTSDGGATTHEVSAPLLSWTSEPWHCAQESVLNTQRHWVECLKSGREPATSGADNLKTYALVMAAYQSAAEHRPVTPISWNG